VVIGCVTLLIVRREEFIFPAMLAYVLWGAVQWAILGFLGRSKRPEEIFWEGEPADPPRSFERRPSHPRSAVAIPAAPTDGTTPSRRDESRSERQSLERREQHREQRREQKGDEQAGTARRRRRRRGGRGNNPSGGGASSPPSSAPNPPSKTDTPPDSST